MAHQPPRRDSNPYFDEEIMALAAAKLMGWNFVQKPREEQPSPPRPQPRDRNPWEPQSLGI